MPKNKRSLEDVKPLNKTYKYILDENNKYHRIGADDMTRMFEQLVITPKGNKYNFVPKYIDNSERAAELRDKMLSRQYTKGFVGEPGLELIHPEFDILSLSSIIKKGSLLKGTKNVSNKGKAKIINNSITGENASKITPAQWTAAQDAAIARGDISEAQRLRDLHFKVSANNTKIVDDYGNPLKLYHGTKNKFNTFDESLYGSTDGGMYGTGVYTTPYKEYAERYGDNIMNLYANIKYPVDARNFSIEDLMIGKLEEGNNIFRWHDIGGVRDGVLGKNHYLNTKYPYEVVSHKPNNVKLADAVTYDDKGIRIPLGKRDNFKLNDIRYSFMPFIIGGTGYGIYNK